jgi:hypothetical protein
LLNNAGKSGLPFVIPELLEQGGSNIRNLKINKVNGEKIPDLRSASSGMTTLFSFISMISGVYF